MWPNPQFYWRNPLWKTSFFVQCACNGSLAIQELCFWRAVLLKKCQKAQIPCVSPFLWWKTYDTMILSEMDRTCKKLWALFQVRSLVQVPRDPWLKQYSKLRYHMFSSTKMEEYMESELSGIFRATLVPKYIVFGFGPTQTIFVVWCFFLKKHANTLNQAAAP